MIEIKKQKLHQAVAKALGNLKALTKRLKVMKTGANLEKNKIVISSNDLNIPGLSIGTKFVLEIDRQAGGFIARPAVSGDKKLRTISYRSYKNRKGLEAVMDIRHQEDIKKALGDAKHVHVVFTKNSVLIRPAYSYDELASEFPTGATIEIKMPDEDGIYSQILKALKVVKSRMLTKVTFETSKEFMDSREHTLLCIQLRRLGFELTSDVGHVLIAQIPDTNDVHSQPKVDLDTVDYSGSHQDVANRFNSLEPLSSFVACTAGVDIKAMEGEGFNACNILEWRPPEKRDFKKVINKETGEVTTSLVDKTDTGALCAAINSKNPRVVFNENIYVFNTNLVIDLIEAFNFLHISIQCDDFSNLKSKSEREKAVANLDTTCDMFIPALEFVEATGSPTLLLENVTNFATSIECALFTKGLKWMGYDVKQKIHNAKDFNGMTSRVRAYLFASKLGEDFEFPEKVSRQAHAWNDIIEPRISQLRDVSHCKSVVKGIETGRIRLIRPGDAVIPTVTKSQSRQTKDSCYVHMNGRYYMPSNEILKLLMGIPDDFNVEPFSAEIQTEIIGQSIEVPMHQAICAKVKQHIERFVNRVNQTSDQMKVATSNFCHSVTERCVDSPSEQLALF